MQSLDQARLTKIKASFATRRVDHGDIAWLDDEASDLKAGDLVVARVERIGQHQRIERPDGRRALLFPGDEILVACGARYAPDQFEADSPTGLGPANLVAAGGIAGLMRLKHDNMKSATEITILGAVCNRRGEPMNLADYAVSTEAWPVSVPVIAVCGTSMNAGKTHTVASLVRGFAQSGQKVAAIKATGTGAGGDLWTFHDFGADHVRDFTDAGFATTYRIPVDAIFAGLCRLAAEAEAAGAEVIVIELADGLFQGETAALLKLDAFQNMLAGVVFAAGDAMGGYAGAAWLTGAGLPLLGISGCMTQSPLAMRELAAASKHPCFTAEELQGGALVGKIPPAMFLNEVPRAA